MGKAEKVKVVEDYGQKLANSGYSMDQIRQIVVAGIRGYGSKVVRRRKEGKPLRRTAKESLTARIRKKLLSKTNWYIQGKKVDHYKDDEDVKGKGKRTAKYTKTTWENRTVLFVAYTEGGELASRLRDLMKRLAPIIGFGVRVVERTGTSLKNNFPLTTLWDGLQCGRTNECITCYQGAERLTDCTKRSVLYENLCLICNQGAAGKGEVENPRQDIPTIYVGESSRSIQENKTE